MVGIYISILSLGIAARYYTDYCVSERKISQLDFYSFLLQHRRGHINTILRSRRLFQEFVVDAYAQIEQSRIRYIMCNQPRLRSALYQGLQDATANGSDFDRVGVPIILPSSFTGGPRYMAELYHDAMAIVRSCGRPDLFITMTCNPQWEDIVDAINPGEMPQDRPDIVARVFRLKLDALLSEICNREIFGTIAAQIHVIEFQKRGLPHAHILIVLSPEYKPQTNDAIDTIVSAEIPDQTLYPQLYETVVKFMLHGPCGLFNRNAHCMKKSKGKICDRKYPRQFCDHTTIGRDGYATHRRRDNGVTVEKHGFLFDNRHIIPYNPYLSQKYDCHINVEIATGITAVKYLHKYIHKGHDRACISAHVHDGDQGALKPRNEPQEYIDSRYVSPAEAVWRIFGFSLHKHKPAVTRLQLHLPNLQTVCYNPDSDPDEILHRSDVLSTTLTAFFELCAANPQTTSTLLYPDCPRSYFWNKSSGSWKKRCKREEGVGRVYFATPTQGEKYYLQLLLYNVPGPSSYESLRMYNGTLYHTFQQACRERGLIDTDDEWDTCLEEAASFQTGHQFRQLFVTILLMNDPTEPIRLFNHHFDSLSDDCRYLLHRHYAIDMPTHDDIQSLVLQKLGELLEKSAKSLEDYKLPSPTVNFDLVHGIPRIITQELNYDRESLSHRWDEGYALANQEQRHALDTIICALDANAGGIFFIDGPGGTGKTFVENLLLAYVRSKGHIALAVASSGIAALLLDGGRTSHSRFKIPIDIHAESQCSIPAQSQLAELLRATKLIVWDEAPAQHRYCAQAVERTLKDIRQTDEPFGGITLVYGGPFPCFQSNTLGDFRQCLPVILSGTRS